MKIGQKIKTIFVAIGALGMLLTMPITLSLADTPDGIQAPSDKEKSFTTIAKGEYCQVKEENYLVIQDRETWEKMWTVTDIQRIPHGRPRDNYPGYQNIPNIDFSKEMVIAVFMGKCPASQFSIEIKRIVENTVYVVRSVPSYLQGLSVHPIPDLPAMRILPAHATSPYHLIKTLASADPLEFHVTTIISNPSINKQH